MPIHQDYSLFHQFIETFLPNGFTNIDPNHPVMMNLDHLMKKNNQFFYIGDAVNLKILYTSKQSKEMIGIDPKDVEPSVFIKVTHPDDVLRSINGRSKLIKLGLELFNTKEKFALFSTNIKIQNAVGGYSNLLNQFYLFYSSEHNTVFFIKLHTNIDWCKKMKYGHYYYCGTDLTQFRYPNREMLNNSGVFTKREFEIIKLIFSGHTSEQIAKKLFLSPYTINTHRVNILNKSGKTTFFEIISELTKDGIL